MFHLRDRFCQRKRGLNHSAGRSRAQQLRKFTSRNRDAIHFKSPFGGDTAILGKLRDGKLPSVEAAVSAARFESVRYALVATRRGALPWLAVASAKAADPRFKRSAAKAPSSPNATSPLAP